MAIESSRPPRIIFGRTSFDTEDVAEEEEVEPTHEWQTRKDDEDDDERKKSFFERAAEIGSAAVGLVRGRRGR